MKAARLNAAFFSVLCSCWIVSIYPMYVCWVKQQWWIMSANTLYDLPAQREWFWRVINRATYIIPIGWVICCLLAGAEFAARRRLLVLSLLTVAPFLFVLGDIAFREGLFFIVTRNLK
jgi:hypothetical protein